MRKSFSRSLDSAILVASVLALASVSQPSAGQSAGGSDWPGLLGPTSDGKSIETGIRKSWPGSGPPLLWHMPVGEGYSAPSVAKGRLFLFDRHGDKLRLTGIDARSGEELWRAEYPTAYEDMYGFSNGPRAVPVIDGDRVYTFGPSGRLRCHKAQDGSLVWDVDTSSRFGVVQSFFGAGSTPVVEGDLLIASIGGWMAVRVTTRLAEQHADAFPGSGVRGPCASDNVELHGV